jgi:hypothetical protein
MRFIVAVIVVLIVIVGAVVIGQSLVARGETVAQPIAFNHAIHLGDAGLACLACHTDAETAVYAGLPGKDICLDCHDPDDMEEGEVGGQEEAKLARFAERDEDIPWVRVAVTVPDVFFSHRRHVTAGGIDCLRCHPGQAELTTPQPAVQLVMTMDDCIDCHEAQRVSNDCLVCHR